jgi:hypothetical protein
MCWKPHPWTCIQDYCTILYNFNRHILITSKKLQSYTSLLNGHTLLKCEPIQEGTRCNVSQVWLTSHPTTFAH